MKKRVEQSIFEVAEGLISLKTFSFSDYLNYSFEDILYDISAFIDHFTITLPSKQEFDAKVEEAHKLGFLKQRGPGIYPNDFCELPVNFNNNLSMNFCSVVSPTNGRVVIVAPISSTDETAKFLRERGPSGVHHIAIDVKNIIEQISVWKTVDFHQLSDIVTDDGLTQVFMKNEAGQIIELINRTDLNKETFTCSNANQLRLSEGSFGKLPKV